MKKSTYYQAFEQSILVKEAELEMEGKLLKEHFQQACESLKPINLIKKTFKQAIAAPDLKESVVDAIIGLTSGYVAKKLIIGKTHNPITNLLSKIIEVVVANKAAKNADEIKSIGSLIVKSLIKH